MWEQVFIYCERGFNPSFWAEPLNAITNVAFLIAGALCWGLLARQPRAERSPFAAYLATLVVIIGIGSFLFHTFATRWAGAADVLPIVLFIFSMIYFALRRFYGAPIWACWLALLLFAGVVAAIGQAPIRLGGLLGYAPALAALLGLGIGLAAIRHPAGTSLIAAGCVFAVSLSLRTIDGPYCPNLSIGGVVVGSHFMWHVLNGVTLYLVTRAAILHGRPLGPQGASVSTSS